MATATATRRRACAIGTDVADEGAVARAAEIVRGQLGEASVLVNNAGVQGLTRTLALELGSFGITVNAVAPGFVVTEMTREVARRVGMAFEDMVADQLRSIHVGRAGEPDDIAKAVAFFADEHASFVTGQILYVAGAPRG